MKKTDQKYIQIAIRATPAYNDIVQDICDHLKLNRPQLFRDALRVYLMETRHSQSQPSDMEIFVDRLIEEEKNMRSYSHYTTNSPQQK